MSENEEAWPSLDVYRSPGGFHYTRVNSLGLFMANEGDIK